MSSERIKLPDLRTSQIDVGAGVISLEVTENGGVPTLALRGAMAGLAGQITKRYEQSTGHLIVHEGPTPVGADNPGSVTLQIPRGHGGDHALSTRTGPIYVKGAGQNGTADIGTLTGTSRSGNVSVENIHIGSEKLVTGGSIDQVGVTVDQSDTSVVLPRFGK